MVRALIRSGFIHARKAGGKRDMTGQFTIPSYIYRDLPEGATFRPEWHAEGILYRYVVDVDGPPPSVVPEWAA